MFLPVKSGKFKGWARSQQLTDSANWFFRVKEKFYAIRPTRKRLANFHPIPRGSTSDHYFNLGLEEEFFFEVDLPPLL